MELEPHNKTYLFTIFGFSYLRFLKLKGQKCFYKPMWGSKKLNSNMCTMCIEYRFALLGNTAKGLFFSISLCIRWKARKRKRGFSFFMAKLFEGNSFLTRVYMREEHFFRFHFQRRGALFRAFKYFRLKMVLCESAVGKSHLTRWPYCIVSDSLLFVNILCFFVLDFCMCTTQHNNTQSIFSYGVPAEVLSKCCRTELCSDL